MGPPSSFWPRVEVKTRVVFLRNLLARWGPVVDTPGVEGMSPRPTHPPTMKTPTQITTTVGPQLLAFRFEEYSLCPACAVSSADCGETSGALYYDQQGNIDVEEADALGMTVNCVGSSVSGYDGWSGSPCSLIPNYVIWEECAECGRSLADHEIEGDEVDC